MPNPRREMPIARFVAAAASRPRAAIALAAVAAIILRLAFGFTLWGGKPLGGDEREYLSLARGLTEGDGLNFTGGLQPEQIVPLPAPGYPFFLALVGAGQPKVTTLPPSVKIAQAFAGGLAVLLLGIIGRRVGGSTAGIAAAWIAACSPPLIWISAFALTEALVWPMGL
ncbi:MAG: hypothetical protein WCQ64_17860, partial [Acidobacteriota bacterium]